MATHAEKVEALQILKKARDLIRDPEYWTTDEYAIDRAGFPVLPNDPDAYAFCALGAIGAAGAKLMPNVEIDWEDWYRDEALGLAIDRLQAASLELFNAPVQDVNDDPDLNHEAVMRVYNTAISKLEQELYSTEEEDAS